MGESGSGKSVSSSAILGLHRGSNAVVSGQILLDGVDLLAISDEEMRRKRGSEVAMIFQDPLSAMHPYYSVGNQIAEAYRVHHSVSKRAAKTRTIEMLERVGIPQPNRRVDDYPHQFSGGMRQRAMIAMALINNPSLLIADEPTTALDVTVQAQILDLLQDLQKEFESAVIIITHDLGVIAEMADDVLVMYAGRAVEFGAPRRSSRTRRCPTPGVCSRACPTSPATPTRELIPIPGNPPTLLNPPPGCAFHPRCAHRDKVPGDLCKDDPARPVARHRTEAHLKRCHLTNPDAVYETRSPAGDRAGPGGGTDERQARRRQAAPGRPRGCPRTTPSRTRGPGRPTTSVDYVAPVEAHAASVADPNAKSILEVRDLKMYFPVKSSGIDPAHHRSRAGRRRHLVPGARGRLARPRRRVRLRQVHDRAPGDPALRAHRRLDQLRRPRHHQISSRQLKPLRREIQMIFQDPYTSLNPRHSVGAIVGAPMAIHGMLPKNKILPRVQELLEIVGLNPEHYNRYPHEFSGGQRQRIGIARALTLHPKVLVADEPVSALDVSIQAQVINLLQDVQREFNIAFLFVAHDLAIVRHFCPEIAVMYLGKIVEIADRETLYNRPNHPYTQALLSAVPDVKQAAIGGRRERIRLEGDVPEPDQPAVRLPVPHPLPDRAGDLRAGRAAAAADRQAPQGRLPLRRRARSPPGPAGHGAAAGRRRQRRAGPRCHAVAARRQRARLRRHLVRPRAQDDGVGLSLVGPAFGVRLT